MNFVTYISGRTSHCLHWPFEAWHLYKYCLKIQFLYHTKKKTVCVSTTNKDRLMLFRSLDVLHPTVLCKYHTQTNKLTSNSTSLLQLHVSAHVMPSIRCTRFSKWNIYIYIYTHKCGGGITTNWYLNFVTIILFKIYNYHENFMKTWVSYDGLSHLFWY